jgi:hypothetical protein
MRLISRSLPLALAIVASFGMAGAHAADAAKAERLIDATGVEQSVIGMQQQLMQAAAQRYMMAAQQRGLDEAQAASGRPAMEAVFQDIQNTMSWDAMKADVVRVHAEVFTDAEIDAALAFYSSAEGRSFMEKQERLMERTGEVAERRVSDAMPRFEAAIEAAVETAASSTPAQPSGQ